MENIQRYKMPPMLREQVVKQVTKYIHSVITYEVPKENSIFI